MTAREPRPGVFRRLAAALTRNWGLKLLSLVIAIVIYYSLKTGDGAAVSNGHERQLFDQR